MRKEITCIGCPMGCRMTAEVENGKILSVEGYSCNVGKKYAQEELTVPKRMVTSLAHVRGSSRPLPVRTSAPIEKSKIFDCLREIRACEITPPVKIGDVIISHVCGTQADIVATREVF
ncbi:DUF1667 domain-containing protein [Caproicibacter sp.]|uniref:DUF1667 domain-containing protein n=1 Tax=Caproicibacter sp. TaxID=2814884 RepID=UPI00398A1AFD